MSNQNELTEEDIAAIREAFYEDIAPKLQRLGARTGAILCDFAGEKFKNWVLHFKSRGESFDVLEFEYDPDVRELDWPF